MSMTLERAYQLLHASTDVLVVEDDEEVQQILSELLATAGYDVRTAGDGFAALAEVEVRRPALVLLDLSLPGMNGWMFLAELRERMHAATPPVILISARPDLPQQAARLGLDHFLAKPFRLVDFYRVLESCA